MKPQTSNTNIFQKNSFCLNQKKDRFTHTCYRTLLSPCIYTFPLSVYRHSPQVSDIQFVNISHQMNTSHFSPPFATPFFPLPLTLFSSSELGPAGQELGSEGIIAPPEGRYGKLSYPLPSQPSICSSAPLRILCCSSAAFVSPFSFEVVVLPTPNYSEPRGNLSNRKE